MAKPGVDIASILAAARERTPNGRSGRSPVYELMWDDHPHLASELNPPRRPNWRAVAEALGKQGVLDGAGQALTAMSAETVRKTWWKVNRDKQAVAAGMVRQRRQAAGADRTAGPPANQARAGTVIPSAPADTTPAASLGMLPPGIEPPEEQPPKYTFKFAKAKDWTKETDKGDE
jgi:hypothetical protein